MAKDKPTELIKNDRKSYGTVMTVINLPPTRLVPFLPSMIADDFEGPPIVGTLDFNDDEGIERFLASGADVDIDRNQATEDWFPVQDWVAEKKQNVSTEEGQVVPGVRVTLFSPDGKTMGFTGAVPHDSFGKIRAIFGDGPWVPALWFKAKAFATSNKKQTYLFLARRTKPEGK